MNSDVKDFVEIDRVVEDTSNMFLLEVNSNNEIIAITNVLKLNNKTHQELANEKLPSDPANTIHAYRGVLPDNDKRLFKFDNGNVINDDNRNNIYAEKDNIKIAQKYLDETDRYVARLYEINAPIPQSVTDLRSHYRTFLDGKGLFSAIDIESQNKLAELSS